MFDNTIYAKLTRYCAYRDRCLREVLTKLKALKAEAEDLNAYAERLKEENYLNEERFVKGFIAGHARKKWGKLKIQNALRSKGVDAALIKKHLGLLDEKDYLEQIKTVAAKKLKSIKGDTRQAIRIKLMRFLLGKGYESGKVSAVIKELRL